MKEKTFNSLLRRYEQSKQDREKVRKIFVESIGEELTFIKKGNDLRRRAFRASSLFMSNVDEDEDNTIFNIMSSENLDVILKEFETIIYDCCQELQDTKLHEACDIKYPYDIVSEILDVAEILNIGCEVLNFILGGGIDVEKKSNEVLELIEN